MDGSEDFSAFVVVVGIAFESASLFSSLSRCPKGCVSFRGTDSLSGRVLAGAQRVAVEPRYCPATSVPPTSSRLLPL